MSQEEKINKKQLLIEQHLWQINIIASDIMGQLDQLPLIDAPNSSSRVITIPGIDEKHAQLKEVLISKQVYDNIVEIISEWCSKEEIEIPTLTWEIQQNGLLSKIPPLEIRFDIDKAWNDAIFKNVQFLDI